MGELDSGYDLYRSKTYAGVTLVPVVENGQIVRAMAIDHKDGNKAYPIPTKRYEELRKIVWENETSTRARPTPLRYLLWPKKDDITIQEPTSFEGIDIHIPPKIGQLKPWIKIHRTGQTIEISESVLLDLKNEIRRREERPSYRFAKTFSEFVCCTIRNYQKRQEELKRKCTIFDSSKVSVRH